MSARAVAERAAPFMAKPVRRECMGNPAPGNAPAKGTDILRQFGPDYRKP